ncbi:MAG: hypothetical protein E7633_01740 [Ruminococcaceae bacterium]|nr:hypothetical protein [Oscillospiraceae bacterium]
MYIPVLVDLTSADVTKPIENMADRLSAAGQTIVLGMLAVFSVLAILWLVLSIMGKFFTTEVKAPKEEKKEEPVAPAAPAAPAAPVAQAPAPVANDEEIVAAITAAISLMLDKPQTAFRVVSFRQASREAFRRNNINRN